LREADCLPKRRGGGETRRGRPRAPSAPPDVSGRRDRKLRQYGQQRV